jgi:cytoskeletal protein CcmA (bactofilin family)
VTGFLAALFPSAARSYIGRLMSRVFDSLGGLPGFTGSSRRTDKAMLGKKEENGGGETLNTIVGRGTTFEGVMKVDNSVRIDGTFKGELSCTGTLTIGQSGEAHAQLDGRDVYINGVVHGNVRGDKVRLDSQARVVGDINSNALAISEGAVFQGNCSMDVDENEGVDAMGAEAPEPVEGGDESVIPMDSRRASGG